MDSVAPEASWRESSPPGNEAQEKYQCPRCPSSFKRPEHLKRHQRSHDGHKPFMCSICAKRFFRSDILTRHELMHLAAQRTNTLNRKRACTECARARERCSRDEPCLRCSTKSLQCLYPDDGGQKAHSLSNETLSSSGNDRGQVEDQASAAASRNFSLLPKNENPMTSSSVNRDPFIEGDASFRDFLYALRSQTSSSYLPPSSSSHSQTQTLLGSSGTGPLQYKNGGYRRERQPSSGIVGLELDSSGGSARAITGNEPSRFAVELGPGPETGSSRQRQGPGPMFEQQPAGSAPFNRPHDLDMIDLAHPRFGGQAAALGDYSNLCPTAAGGNGDPHSYAFHPDTIVAAAAGVAGSASSAEPAVALDQQSDHFAASDSDGLLATADSAAASGTSRRPLSLSSFSSQPINLKAYEVIASNFKELYLEYGDGNGSAAPIGNGSGISNNISESQRTAQHELLVKLYYEHFKQQAY